MTRSSTNLLPAPRRQLRHQTQRKRFWVIAGVVYTAICVAGVGVLAGIWADDWSSTDEQAITNQHRITDAQSILTKLQPELATAKQQLAALKRVSEQPDWSILLTILSQTAGNGVALTSCRAAPKFTEPTPRPQVTPALAITSPPEVTGYSIDLTGTGRSQLDVSSFVVRLEQTKLFDKVLTGRAPGDTGLNGQGVPFRVTCEIDCEAKGAR